MVYSLFTLGLESRSAGLHQSVGNKNQDNVHAEPACSISQDNGFKLPLILMFKFVEPVHHCLHVWHVTDPWTSVSSLLRLNTPHEIANYLNISACTQDYRVRWLLDYSSNVMVLIVRTGMDAVSTCQLRIVLVRIQGCTHADCCWPRDDATFEDMVPAERLCEGQE